MDEAESEISVPEIGRNRGMELFIVWFVLEMVFVGFAWRSAETYNPEGNGLFNLNEATLLSQAWIKVSASLLASIFTSIAFGIGIIASRLRTIAVINRAGYLALIHEIRNQHLGPMKLKLPQEDRHEQQR